jgi:hypothetical protein
MKLKFAVSAALIGLMAASVGQVRAADDQKSRLERAGNCKDAKSQMEYFCDEKNAASDSMVAIGTACNNAKNNVKAACEGIDAPDPEYKFDDRKK